MNKPEATDRKKYKILVVDDEEVIRKLLMASLKPNYFVELSNDGIDAVEKVKTFKPDLFLVDNMMPRMNGFELVKALRENAEFANTPIIMLTAKDGVRDKVEGFTTGVDDYITKPFNIMELNVRIESFLRKSQKTKYVNTLMSSMGTGTSQDDISLLGHDLKAAAAIQFNMMPTKFPVSENFAFGAKMIPAKTVGGDFYDFIPIDNERVAICVGDVSGKGITAALLMVMVRTLVRVLLAENLPLIDICNKINSMLIRDVGMGKFITIFIAILNIETGIFESYVNAGHLPPFIIKKDMSVGQLDSTGPFLGAFPQVEIASASYKFDEGDLITIYTDGVTEAEKESLNFFGEDRLLDFLKAYYKNSPQEAVDKIVSEVSNFSPNKNDDVTLVLIKNTGKRD